MFKKIFLIILILLLIFSAFFLFLYYPVIFQEKDFGHQVKGIYQLEFSGRDLVKLRDGKYLTKSERGESLMMEFMDSLGYNLTERMGSAYLFVSWDGDQATLVHRQYSRHYSLWFLLEKEKGEEIASKECLDKSRLEDEACREFLSRIVNYEKCLQAGFPTEENDSSRCLVSDGRVFVKKNNATWEMALVAINNCEVERVLQTHSLEVYLDLKNGESLLVYEPRIDEIMRVLDGLRSGCGPRFIAIE